MNYIKQLTHFFNKSSVDPYFTPTHMSLFMALFQSWNQARFTQQIQIIRDDIMRLSKINSKATYHKAMAFLHTNRYIEYKPSYNPLKGSQISFFPTNSPVSSSKNEPVHILTTRPLNEPYNKLSSTNIITDNISTHSREKKKKSNQEIDRSQFSIPQFKKEKSSAKKENAVPPATHQVEEFFISQQSTIQEAQRFINHYTANGWLVGGKSPMIDWKASGKNWISNAVKFNTNAKQDKSPRAQQLHSNANKNYFEPL